MKTKYKTKTIMKKSKSKSRYQNENKSKNKSKNNKEEFDAISDMNLGGEFTTEQYIGKFISVFFSVLAVIFFMTLNFISLSCCLTLNKDKPMMNKIVPIFVSFFFGFIYFTVYILGYHVGTKKESINFDKKNLFPF